MNRSWAATLFSALAGVVFVAGVCASATALLQYKTTRRGVARSITSLERLSALEVRASELDAWYAPFEALDYESLIDPRVLVESAFGPGVAEELRQEAEGCGQGYVVNRVRISLKGAALKDIAPFVRTAESLRPPLRLTACTIRASDTHAGTGDVTLKLERIECGE
jgi:hypothetical protein